jgi:glycine cleavage system H protein
VTEGAGRLAGFLFHPGHTWAHVHEDGLVSIGTTDFASNFTGNLAAIELPKEGRRIRQGERAWTLVAANDRRLRQTMPIDGRIIAVNDGLLKDPGLTQRSPYEEGWILRVRPRHLDESARNLLPETVAQGWIDAAQARITSVLSPAMGAVAYDGGEWVTGFGDQLSDPDWETLKRDLFPS